MITLANFTVNQFNTNSILLEFEFTSSTPNELGPYTLSIYRSETAGEKGSLVGFENINATVSVSGGNYLDTDLDGLATPGRLWFYKLCLTHTDTSTLIFPDYAAYYKQASIDKPTKEILRQKRIVLEKFSGRKIFLIKRKTWGSHCSLCWDDVLFRATDAYCTECQGTGWSTGYIVASPFYAMITPSPERNQIMMFGEWKPSDVLLETLNYPPLREKDVIADDSGNRWVIVQVQKLEKLGYLIEQRAQMALIEYDDIIYKVAVDFTKSAEKYRYGL